MKGIEPSRLAAPEPKSGASAYFATSALDKNTLVFIYRQPYLVLEFFHSMIN